MAGDCPKRRDAIRSINPWLNCKPSKENLRGIKQWQSTIDQLGCRNVDPEPRQADVMAVPGG
jgi:hypothetical protein